MNTTVEKDHKGMVLVPATTYVMGASEKDSATVSADELPAHRVKVDSFYIDIYPVTQSEFEKIMGFNPSMFARAPESPVDSVSRPQAIAYCDKVGKRLPTEAEWECAARAGATGLLYWGAEDYRDYAFLFFNSGYRTKGVGLKKPNGFGLHDTIGNVWEWCSDWYDPDYYKVSPAQNPKGPEHGSAGVLRGCSWFTKPEDARVTRRKKEDPVNPSVPSIIGLRCVLG